MLSHDLKNPITAVIGSIDIMREGRLGPVNPEQVEYLQSAIDSCNEVVAMVDNLLGIHRIEAGKMQMKICGYNPVDIIKSIAGKFDKVTKHEQLKLRVELAEEIPVVLVDKNALTRVIANLLGNAVKFTPEGGEIAIICGSCHAVNIQENRIPGYISLPEGFSGDHRFLTLCVRDTGGGIPEEDQKHIFERFYQSQRHERGGAGLGLAYCKMAVEKMGGVIWVESELGAGSSFKILLPCQNGSVPE